MSTKSNTAMDNAITLEDIRVACIGTHARGFSQEDFLRKIIPDIFKDFRTQPSHSNFFPSHPERVLSGGAPEFTKKLLTCLVDNTSFSYINGSLGKNCLQSMFENIRFILDEKVPDLSADHEVFTKYSLATPDKMQLPLYTQLEYILKMLRFANTRQSLCYAVFLLILCAFFHDDIEKLPHLYEPKKILEVISPASTGVWEISKNHTLFTDPNYMHEYFIYLYRVPREGKGRGTLYRNSSFKLENSKSGIPSAILSLRLDSKSIQFTGTPLLSEKDQMVYVIMRNPDEQLGILCFKYDTFHSSNMYLRTGILITSTSIAHEPCIQKVIITSKQLTEAEYPLIEGFLKSFSNTLYLTPDHLERFQNQFSDQNWMEQFTTIILPHIESYKETLFTITENELLSFSKSSLDPLDRLRLLLSLRSIETTSSVENHQFICISEPSALHDLMKPTN